MLLAIEPHLGEEVIASPAPGSSGSKQPFVIDDQAYFPIDTTLWHTESSATTTSGFVVQDLLGGVRRLDAWSGEVLALSSDLWLTNAAAPSGAIPLTSFDELLGFQILDHASLTEPHRPVRLRPSTRPGALGVRRH